MSINEYLVLAIGGIVLLLIYYIVSRDAQQTKQIRAIATAIEKINNQLFSLEKDFNQRLSIIEENSADTMSSADLNYELEVGISEYTAPLKEQLSKLVDDLTSTKEQLNRRILPLEENIKNLSLPSSVTGLDDERIIALYKQGIGIDAISKELRLSKAEVEFVLKINQLK